jgi:hypothetical protein
MPWAFITMKLKFYQKDETDTLVSVSLQDKFRLVDCQVGSLLYSEKLSSQTHSALSIGWDDGSWGYHGDDGNAFACSGTGRPYGPTFTTGDTIGCLINLTDYTAGYTKNGLYLGTAFMDLRADVKDKRTLEKGLTLYPLVGLRTPGEAISTNFGHKPFLFDIENYVKVGHVCTLRWKETHQKESVKEERVKFLRGITQGPPPSLSLGSTPFSLNHPQQQQGGSTTSLNSVPNISPPMDAEQTLALVQSQKQVSDLILSHLIHEGFPETAKSFFASLNLGAPSVDGLNEWKGTDSLEQRKDLKEKLKEGKVADVLKELESKDPSFLNERPLLHFGLRLQEFIEKVRGVFDGSSNVSGEDSMDLDDQENVTDEEDEGVQEKLLEMVAFGRRIQLLFAELETSVQEAMTVCSFAMSFFFGNRFLLIMNFGNRKFFHCCVIRTS